MSHDIRTPINAILGMDEMILREFDNETLMEYASNIRNAGQNLLGLVNDILDFSKIEAGKMEIIPVDYEMSSLLNDLVSMIQKRASDKGLYVELLAPLCPVSATSPDLPMISGDDLREAYETIREMITSFDYDSIMFVLESLEGYRLPETEQGRYKELKSSANKADWEALRRILAEPVH